MVTEPMGVSIFVGTFESQPLVFAHLLDLCPGLDFDHVEVICGVDPGPRLAHALTPQDAAAVEDALGLRTTVVMIFEAAMPIGAERLPQETGLLSYLARFMGFRHRPAP